MRPAHAVPARPRPHRPLEVVPAAQAQDAGLHRPEGRPLPHAPHAHARDGRDLAHGRAGAPPQRGPHRGDRPRSRPRATRPSATPGEEVLDEVLFERFGRRFRHNEQSLRVVEVLERDGRGLNLTEEMRDGILNHTGAGEPATLEGKIVRLVDRVAYINHDIDDALRAGLLRAETCRRKSSRSWASAALAGSTRSSTTSSRPRPRRATSSRRDEIGRAMLDLRAFMFERVYLGPAAQKQRDTATETVRRIFDRPRRAPGGAARGSPGDVCRAGRPTTSPA